MGSQLITNAKLSELVPFKRFANSDFLVLQTLWLAISLRPPQDYRVHGGSLAILARSGANPNKFWNAYTAQLT